MPESKDARIFESFRNVRPGRLIPNRLADGALHKEEYAAAVVGPDGELVGLTTTILLADINQSLAENTILLRLILAALTGGATETSIIRSKGFGDSGFPSPP